MSTAYDDVPYPSRAFPQTHPDRLAVLATLFGMDPPPVGRCRVLELGCGDGANLIPIAYACPESRFVGVDLTQAAIARGQSLIETLKLANITLRALDLVEIDPAFGQFDYIIAHGLYSWVPSEVREKILAIARANLAPSGVAYVSYNCLPGGYMHRMLSEILKFHTRGLTQAADRIREARALARYLKAFQHAPDVYRTLLEREAARLETIEDGFLFHDDLAELNAPLYFHEFADHAARHGLQFLAEADFFEMQPPPVPAGPGAPRFPSHEDVVGREQYLDFTRCRRFRQTLLCHAAQSLERTAQPERIERFHLASSLEPRSPAPDLRPGAVEEFRGSKGATLTTDHPAAKAALVELRACWPGSLPFAKLLDQIRARLSRIETDWNGQPPTTPRQVCELVLKMYSANLVELYCDAPRFVLQAGERPQASAVARLQLASGKLATNLRHRMVEVADAEARRLLTALDGTRDRATLAQELSLDRCRLDTAIDESARMALLIE